MKKYRIKKATEKEIIRTLESGEQLIAYVKEQIKDMEQLTIKKRNHLYR